MSCCCWYKCDKYFLQTPDKHLRGQGCPICYGTKKQNEEFPYNGSIRHLGRYTYSNFIYKNNRTKGLITCTKHGDFLQRPTDHLKGQGCPICASEKRSIQLTKCIDYTKNFKSYKQVVRRLTEMTYKKFKQELNPSNHNRGKGYNDYHLDHKFSIYEGFKNNINPEIIASKGNLQILSVSGNLIKNRNSSILLDELMAYESLFITSIEAFTIPLDTI